jgi:hypothetical protein
MLAKNSLFARLAASAASLLFEFLRLVLRLGKQFGLLHSDSKLIPNLSDNSDFCLLPLSWTAILVNR